MKGKIHQALLDHGYDVHERENGSVLITDPSDDADGFRLELPTVESIEAPDTGLDFVLETN